MDGTLRNAGPKKEPIFNAPAVVIGLAVLLVALFALFNWMRPEIQDQIIRNYAFVPGRLTVSIWPGRAIDLINRANSDPSALEQARLMGELHALSGGAKPWTLLTYALLHGSWTHVTLNTVWLLAFGPPVARRFGAARFLVFIGVTAIAAALAQWAIGPMEFMPLIGVSGADSGLMGAAARFMFQPGAPLGQATSKRWDIETVPAAPLSAMLTDPRARIFLVIWLATNFVFGAFARSLGLSDMPVAWVAHLGGFVVGMLIFPLFDRTGRVATAA